MKRRRSLFWPGKNKPDNGEFGFRFCLLAGLSDGLAAYRGPSALTAPSIRGAGTNSP